MQDPATTKTDYEEAQIPATQPLPDCGADEASPTQEAGAEEEGQRIDQGEFTGDDEFGPEVPMADPPRPEGGSGGGG